MSKDGSWFGLLEKRGFIRRVPSADDRRKVIVQLTEDGRRAWQSTFDPQTNEEASLLATLQPAEREQLDSMLRRMLHAVDRPGLLDTPTSSQSRADSAVPRSRFTPDAPRAAGD